MSSAQSNVGNSQLYEAGDQRTSKEDHQGAPAYEAGQENSHLDLDSKDERSIGNRLAAAEKHSKLEKQGAFSKSVDDPLAPAQAHGNEPSRGAKVDAEIQNEEEEYLKRKGKA